MLTDYQIELRCKGGIPLLSPFVEKKERVGTISHGLQPFGYDLRLDNKFKWITGTKSQDGVIDPFKMDDITYDDIEADSYVIPAYNAVLGRSLEFIKMHRDLEAVCLTKSTYARLGLIAHTTGIEPGWEGFLTIELANLSPFPIRVHAFAGICQIMFHHSKNFDTPVIAYEGKYQNQVDGVTEAK